MILSNKKKLQQQDFCEFQKISGTIYSIKKKEGAKNGKSFISTYTKLGRAGSDG
jgi:hypothetical protein